MLPCWVLEHPGLDHEAPHVAPDHPVGLCQPLPSPAVGLLPRCSAVTCPPCEPCGQRDLLPNTGVCLEGWPGWIVGASYWVVGTLQRYGRHLGSQ